jgi:hypothetical protein
VQPGRKGCEGEDASFAALRCEAGGDGRSRRKGAADGRKCERTEGEEKKEAAEMCEGRSSGVEEEQPEHVEKWLQFRFWRLFRLFRFCRFCRFCRGEEAEEAGGGRGGRGRGAEAE